VRIIAVARYRWEPATVGSNFNGRWVEESAAQALNVQRKNADWLRKLQDQSGEGSLITQAMQRMRVR
jgi:hypothetical protein